MSKKKYKKNRKKYNKEQFTDIVCAQCDLCEVVYDPWFCYEQIYKPNPKRFFKSVYPELLKARDSVETTGYDISTFLGVNGFRGLFCDSGVCGKPDGIPCKNEVECIANFKNQSKGIRPANVKLMKIVGRITMRKKKNKQKRKKMTPRVFKPYPTFFTNAGEEWTDNMKKTLEK